LSASGGNHSVATHRIFSGHFSGPQLNQKLFYKSKLVSKKFDIRYVSQGPGANLRHLAEPLGGAVGLLEAVSFKEATQSVCRGRTAKLR